MLIYPGFKHDTKMYGGRKSIARLQTRGHQVGDDIFINAAKNLRHIYPSKGSR
jgi:hypothetical protein